MASKKIHARPRYTARTIAISMHAVIQIMQSAFFCRRQTIDINTPASAAIRSKIAVKRLMLFVLFSLSHKC